MRLDRSRIDPLEAQEWSTEAREMMQPFIEQDRVDNIFKTLAHYPELANRWFVFGSHILGNSSLSDRDRELLILRTGYLCQSGYEWGQHVEIAREAGMSDEEIRWCKSGPETPGLGELDRLLLQAADELHSDAFVSDATWSGLSEHYSKQQLLDLLFTVGQYTLVSMVLNSLGVPLDEGLPGWDI
jgi:alkylhydroperoxidase family enzyme